MCGRLIGVGHIRQRYVDLVSAGALDLGLGDTERVDPLAHDVDRLIDRLACHLRLFGGLRLIDEGDAALEVQTQNCGLGNDHKPGENEQPCDEQQDEKIAAAVGHRAERLLCGRQDEQQPAVIVVSGEEIGARFGRQIPLGVDLNLLIKRAHAPLQNRPNRIALLSKAQAEYITNWAPNNALVIEPCQLECAASAGDYAGVVVTDEERRIWSRKVVIEQFEDESEAALFAAFRLSAETVAGID